MSNETNKDKSNHGNNAKGALKKVLDFCVTQGLLKKVTSPYKMPKKSGDGYKKDQFSVAFLATFPDGNQWSISSTTSFRDDRFREPMWNAFFLKQMNPNISKSLVSYPDAVTEEVAAEFKRRRAEIEAEIYFSSIDNIYNYEELYTQIEKEALKDLSEGQYKDKRGKLYEERVASTLKYDENLKKWKGLLKDRWEVGIFYEQFKLIITSLGFKPEDISSISATTDIPKLPSGGEPKTDVLMTVFKTDGTEEKFTISCKSTNKTSVTLAQFKAEDIAEAVLPGDEELKSLLCHLQESCAPTEFRKDYGEGEYNRLTEILSANCEQLSMWAMGGYGTAGATSDQLADYMLTYDDETGEYSFHSIKEYYKAMQEKNIKGQFGTVFTYTYSSGEKGKNLQLKFPVI